MTTSYNYSTSSYGRRASQVHTYANSTQRMQVYYYMEYLPTRYAGTNSQIQDRRDIFNFKDGNCASHIVNGLADGIRRIADSNTVVCFLPASTSYKTVRRYSCVSDRLSAMTGVRCSYNAISKMEDSDAGHIAGKSSDPAAEFTFDPSFFSGKKVILIDDVITRGTTLESTAKRLIRMGAREVVGLVVAKTINPDWTGAERRNLVHL